MEKFCRPAGCAVSADTHCQPGKLPVSTTWRDTSPYLCAGGGRGRSAPTPLAALLVPGGAGGRPGLAWQSSSHGRHVVGRPEVPVGAPPGEGLSVGPQPEPAQRGFLPSCANGLRKRGCGGATMGGRRMASGASAAAPTTTWCLLNAGSVHRSSEKRLFWFVGPSTRPSGNIHSHSDTGGMDHE